MSAAVKVSDSLSNANEQIEYAARTIGRSQARRHVFSAIYYHKEKLKTVTKIIQRTGLPRIRVLQEGRHLARKGIVQQRKKLKNRDTGYEMIDFFQAHKKEILALAGSAKKLASYPTKRKSVPVTINIKIPENASRVQHITVDEISSLSKN